MSMLDSTSDSVIGRVLSKDVLLSEESFIIVRIVAISHFFPEDITIT